MNYTSVPPPIPQEGVCHQLPIQSVPRILFFHSFWFQGQIINLHLYFVDYRNRSVRKRFFRKFSRFSLLFIQTNYNSKIIFVKCLESVAFLKQLNFNIKLNEKLATVVNSFEPEATRTSYGKKIILPVWMTPTSIKKGVATL